MRCALVVALLLAGGCVAPRNAPMTAAGNDGGPTSDAGAPPRSASEVGDAVADTGGSPASPFDAGPEMPGDVRPTTDGPLVVADAAPRDGALPDGAPRDGAPPDAGPVRGSAIWTQMLPRVTNTIERNGAVFVSGMIDTEFEGVAPLTGRRDTYLARFDLASGQRIWLRRFSNLGPYAPVDVADLAIEGGGVLLTMGLFEGTVDFGGTQLTATPSANTYLARYSPDGDLLEVRAGLGGDWSASRGALVAYGWLQGVATLYRTLDDTSPATVPLVGRPDINSGAFDAQGNLILGGTFFDTITVGTTVLRTAVPTDNDGWVARFSPTGAPLWAVPMAVGADEGSVLGVATAGNGDVVVVGTYRQQVAVGTSALTSLGNYDIFTARLGASTGDVLWVRGFGGTGDDRSYSVVVTPADDVIVAGSIFGGTLSIDGTGLAPPGFAVRLAGSDGHTIWASQSQAFPMSVVVAPGGEIVTAGSDAITRLVP
jgi:hypothetical protein